MLIAQFTKTQTIIVNSPHYTDGEAVKNGTKQGKQHHLEMPRPAIGNNYYSEIPP